MAGPRKSTIAKKLAEIIEVLQGNKRSAEKKVESALKRAERLHEKLDGADVKKRAPSAYAKFVKSDFAKTKKANPEMAASEIMQVLAKKWNASKKAAPKAAAPAKKATKKATKKA